MRPSARAAAAFAGWRRTDTSWPRDFCRSSKIPRALDRYIAASQVGITLSSLILGAYGQATLAPRLEPLLERSGRLEPATVESASAAIVLVFLTMLAVILGELVPKSLALQNPTRTALFTVLPMQWSLRAFSWSIALPQRQRRLAAARASQFRPPDIVTCIRQKRSRC